DPSIDQTRSVLTFLTEGYQPTLSIRFETAVPGTIFHTYSHQNIPRCGGRQPVSLGVKEGICIEHQVAILGWRFTKGIEQRSASTQRLWLYDHAQGQTA